MQRRLMVTGIILVVMLSVAACAPATKEPSTPATTASQPTTPANTELILSTTTSTQDSGLLDDLVPLFEQQTGYHVKVIAVGTGAALKMGSDGNADVLLVHAPAAEKDFMATGAGVDRRLVMHNDFVIVGPPGDPAGIKGTKLAKDAFKMLADKQAVWVSRADDSGTNKMELSLWKAAGVDSKSLPGLIETGQGMAATLKITSEKAGYTLTDRATYLAQKSVLQLDILVEKDPALLNVYHVIGVNPEKFPKVNAAGARAFSDFLVSPDIQKRISEFGVAKYGQPLFFADANKTDADLGLP